MAECVEVKIKENEKVLNMSSLFDHVDQVEDGPACGIVHLGEEEALQNPETVPVVELAEATARDDKGMGHIEEGVALLVKSHIILHLIT
jgi:hypothetical protein